MKSKQFSLYLLFILLAGSLPCFSQTWVDTLDSYARLKYMPPSQYMWTWQDAALLNTFVKEYDHGSPSQKQVYLNYIKKAMDKTYAVARGKTPNGVASGLGLAFMYRVTKDDKYKKKAEKVYLDYLKIRRINEGAVSHLQHNTELWDDTMFMIGQFLLSMYQATGDEKYLEEFVKQLKLHREKLQDKEWGLWVHGWDNDNKDHCAFCGQTHWPDKQTRRSAEIWGRGNGWIVVTLADALDIIPKSNPHWNELAGYVKEMIQHLPELQDRQTGHWYQLPVRNKDPNNYIESSCTAMFGYGIEAALRLVVSDSSFRDCTMRAYKGLRENSIATVGHKYLTAKNVCTGTCIGDKDYYLHRSVQKGRPFGIGMFIQFGRSYELDNKMR